MNERDKISPAKQIKLKELNGEYYYKNGDNNFNRKLSVQPYEDTDNMYQTSYSRQFNMIKKSLYNVRGSQSHQK